jgi:hypothetical protein
VNRTRVLIVTVGVLLPYAARIPGMIGKGLPWFTSYLGSGPGAVLFFAAFNAICWGSILAATFTYRDPRSAWFPAVLGFALPALAHVTLDLASDPQAAIALVFIPIYALPLVLVGWLLGLWFDRKVFGTPRSEA